MNQQFFEEKFLEIIRQNKKLIYKVCNSYCKDTDDRKDLQQEIIIQLWKSFENYDDSYKLSTWLYRIALNTGISFYRKETTRNNVMESMKDNIIWMTDETMNEHEEELELNIKMLYTFIMAMNKLDKALMILYLDNNSYKEIAEILGITETNVATKISRIKQTLKKQFSNINK